MRLKAHSRFKCLHTLPEETVTCMPNIRLFVFLLTGGVLALRDSLLVYRGQTSIVFQWPANVTKGYPDKLAKNHTMNVLSVFFCVVAVALFLFDNQ